MFYRAGISLYYVSFFRRVAPRVPEPVLLQVGGNRDKAGARFPLSFHAGQVLRHVAGAVVAEQAPRSSVSVTSSTRIVSLSSSGDTARSCPASSGGRLVLDSDPIHPRGCARRSAGDRGACRPASRCRRRLFSEGEAWFVDVSGAAARGCSTRRSERGPADLLTKAQGLAPEHMYVSFQARILRE